MKNPAMILPDAMQALQALGAVAANSGAPQATLHLAHQRASQINGCHFCIEWGTQAARQAGETDERLSAVEDWRQSPCFTDAERAALALTEAVTRLCDRPDAVPDEVWDEAARHYNERELAGLILYIATTNVWNRLNVTVRQ